MNLTTSHRIARGLFPVLICALLAAALPGPHAIAGPRSPRASAATTLFRWKIPAAGHSGPWIFGHGVAAYDGESTQTLFPRYRLKNMTDFAVQAAIRSPGPGGPKAYLTGFGLVLRRKISEPHTSIEAGSFQSTDSENRGPELYWNGDTVGGEAFDPGKSWHVYRLEVHSSAYTLFVDGKQMVSYTIDDNANPRGAGFFSLYDKVEVKDFRVLSLPGAGATAPHYPPVKQLDLTLADLPTDAFYQPFLRHYYPNVETARERGVGLSEVQATGRVTGYAVDFYTDGGPVADVYASVTAYTTATAAAADIPNRMRSFRQGYSRYPNYREYSSVPVGESGQGLSLDVSAGDYPIALLAMLFQRGKYGVLMRVSINRGSMTSDQLMDLTVNLSKTVDARIQAVG